MELDPNTRDRVRKIIQDPLEFLKCCRSLDQVDRANPIKPLPVHREYLKLYVRVWQRERLMLVPKSRRMTMSWVNIALIVWDTMFHAGRSWALVSKKEADSDELVERCKFILENLDHELLPKEFVPKWERTFCNIEFPELSSKIMGVASGADQLRQFTFSGIMGDEMAFWDNAEEMFGASYPTIEGKNENEGGKFIGISSPAPGFFQRMVEDKIDDKMEAASQPKVHTPMQGVRIWKNKNNKFCVFELHYSADEDKRSPEWKIQAKAGLTQAKWDQEYELKWLSFAGQPVYPDWNKRIHGVDYELKPHLGLPLLIGFDFGLTPAAIIAQLQENQLVALKEYIGVNIGAERFVEFVSKQLRTQFASWPSFRKDYLCFIDPSGAFRKDTDEGTCAMILDKAGFLPRPGPVAFEARRTAVEHFLVTMNKGKPTLQVAQRECPTLTKGFDGGYMYPEGALELKADTATPIKNIFSHVHDAWQYLCWGVQSVRLEQRRQYGAPAPGYGFQGREKR